MRDEPREHRGAGAALARASKVSHLRDFFKFQFYVIRLIHSQSVDTIAYVFFTPKL